MLPWLVGLVSSHTGQLRVGLVIAIAGVLTQLVLSSVLMLLFPTAGTDSV